MNVPFYDMRPANEACRSKIDAAMNRVLDNSWYILGDELKTFEQNFAQYCGAAHCIGVNSGTDALWLALLAAGVGPGDEVVTVAHTFVATAISIIKTGAVPVFADVDPETLLIDPESVKERITGSTKVILPVHLYGRCADLSSIIELGSKHGIDVIVPSTSYNKEVRGRQNVLYIDNHADIVKTTKDYADAILSKKHS